MSISTSACVAPARTPASAPASLTASARHRHFLERPDVGVAGYYPAPGRRYAEVLVIADFAATGDEFHRRLIGMGQSLGSRVSLLHLPGDREAEECDNTSDILLEGLLQRMQMAPGRCKIEPSRPAVAIAAQRGSSPDSKLIVVGRSCAHARQPAFEHLLDLACESGCDLIAVDDSPDWD